MYVVTARLMDVTPPLLVRTPQGPHSSNPSVYSLESALPDSRVGSQDGSLRCGNITRSFCSDPRCPSIEYIRELEYLLEVVTKERDEARIVVDDIGRLLT